MGKCQDLVGQKFGLLTVIKRGEDYVSPKGNRRPRWVCQCDCGGTTLVVSAELKNGSSRSCGCLQRKLARERALTNATSRSLDITGMRFGKLIALKPTRKEKSKGWYWLCQCDCGKTTEKIVKELRGGNVQSCGCLRDEKIAKVNQRHGKSHKSRLYNVWNGMRQRCNDPNHKSYANYGGRGIKVCSEWDEFEAFEAWAYQNGYDQNASYGQCTIDRIDVDGNYEPSNCRWADSKTQANNKRTRK